MKIVSPVFSTDGDYYGDVICVVIDMTPDLARRIMERKKHFDAIKAVEAELLCIEFWDGSPSYYTEEDSPENFDQPDSEWREATEGEEFKGDGARVECAKVILYDDGCVFSASPKHSDIYLSSDVILYKDIVSCI